MTQTTVFYAYRDSPPRRSALESHVGDAERYLLYGLDELVAGGLRVRHNLERTAPPPSWARVAGGASKRALEWAGGYGGDFATVLASLGEANRADVVFSTVDTVGIPLILLRRAGRVRPPLVYAAIGLPERLARLRGERMRRLYASALGTAATIVAYSEYEAETLRGWLEDRGRSTPVGFVPFGVNTKAFRPSKGAPVWDVVSVGADPHRDYELLLQVASTMPETSFLLVTTADRVRTLSPPANVSVEADLPFAEMQRRLSGARVVALPVRENSYSGATTVLLQSMATGKPAVVTQTRAIAAGYHLRDHENCRLVSPGDATAFARALGEVLQDETRARELGARARETVERELSWDRYADRIEAILLAAAERPAPLHSVTPEDPQR